MRVKRPTGGTRHSALWGRGGRGFPAALIAFLALALPAAAVAHGGSSGSSRGGTYVSPGLREHAKRSPGAKLDVIIQSTAGAGAAARAFGSVGQLRRNLGVVNGVAVQIPAARLDALARIPGLSITPDAPVKLDSYYSRQLWPTATKLNPLWGNTWNPAPQAPAIAVVDSGIDAQRADFGGRVVANVNLSTLPNNSSGDGRGHGTFVAGIAAGSADAYAGAAPNAPIVSLDVMDDTGKARTSDVIAAAQWILANKNAYNIKVANFSLHSATRSNFTRDPLDRAVEKLWFAGVVVVAAAGNYGSAAAPSGVPYAPGNDPFVITVGAVDLHDTGTVNDDTIAPWSAYGYTYDGFRKPEVSAAGRYIVGPVSAGATLASERPEKVVAPGYMQLSGTSFAAPVVAGAAAQILARHPDWTPGQVKGALMASTRLLPLATAYAGGRGEISAAAAAGMASPPNPNAALDRFVVRDSTGGVAFDTVSWLDAADSDVSWDSVSWLDVSWGDVSWGEVAWSDVSWGDVSWLDVSWEDVSWEDAAEGDTVVPGGYLLDDAQLEAAQAGTLGE